MKLAISEVFYSLQGEGLTMGRPSVFVRLGGCNLLCGGQGTQFDNELHNGATWRCDSIEVWMKAQSKEFVDVLKARERQALENGAVLILTGGEPMMVQSNLQAFIQFVRSTINPSIKVEIETNGTIKPNIYWHDIPGIQFNCSPKMKNSGNEKEIRLLPEALLALDVFNTQFKFVISSEDDWKEIENDFLPYISKEKIVLMPAGENQELLNETRLLTAEIAIHNYVNYSDRLHVVIWNKKTGV